MKIVANWPGVGEVCRKREGPEKLPRLSGFLWASDGWSWTWSKRKEKRVANVLPRSLQIVCVHMHVHVNNTVISS